MNMKEKNSFNSLYGVSVTNMNIRQIEKQIDEKTNKLFMLLLEINELENKREKYYKNQKSWCKKIKNIIKGNENHIPFID